LTLRHIEPDKFWFEIGRLINGLNCYAERSKWVYTWEVIKKLYKDNNMLTQVKSVRRLDRESTSIGVKQYPCKVSNFNQALTFYIYYSWQR